MVSLFVALDVTVCVDGFHICTQMDFVYHTDSYMHIHIECLEDLAFLLDFKGRTACTRVIS